LSCIFSKKDKNLKKEEEEKEGIQTRMAQCDPFVLSSAARTTTSDDEGASEGQITACMSFTVPCNKLNCSLPSDQSNSVFESLTICNPFTGECRHNHISSVMVGKLNSLVFEPLNPIKIFCDGIQTSSVIAKLPVEDSGLEVAAIAKSSTKSDGPVTTELCKDQQISSDTARHMGLILQGVCDPKSGICINPKKDRRLCIYEEANTIMTIDDSVISEKGKMHDIAMLAVCSPGGRPCHQNHHD
jgi:hypothetical protein